MKYINYIKNNIWLSTFTVFTLFFCVYGSIYFFVDGIYAIDDHFFHIKIAQLLRVDGLGIINNFKWISIGANRYEVSLFQIFLMPFTFFSNLFNSIRISDTFWAASSLAVIYFSLRKFRFKYAFLMVLFLFSSAYFSNRLFLGRAYILTFGLMLLEFYFIQKKKYWSFFGIAFVHILWHQASFFFPLMTVFAVESGRYLAEKKINFKNFSVALMAIVSGMAFFPDFPRNIYKWFLAVANLSLEASGGLKMEGGELYTKNIFDILNSNQIVSFLAITSIVLVIYLYLKNRKEENNIDNNQKENLIEIYSFFLMLIVFVLGSIKISGRFYDYYFLLVIVLWVSILKLLFYQKDIIINKKISNYCLVAFFIFFFYLGLNNYLNLRINVANSDYKTIKAPVEWIHDNSSEKELVYLYNWSDFVMAFFYDDKNIYSWGIEPKVLNNRDPKLYWKAYNILAYGYYCDKQEDCEADVKLNEEKYKKLSEEDKKKEKKENSRKIINSVKNDFGSRFILSTSNGFSELIKLNGDLIEDSFEAVSEKNPNYKITAFRLK